MESLPSVHAETQNRKRIYELFAQHVSSGKAAFLKSAGIDFVLGRRGPYIWDIEGEKRLIDCHCNGGVCNLGHRHPEIISTLTQSLEQLDIGDHHLISAKRASLTGTLSHLTPGHLKYTVFGVGGGEAVDLAIKIARGHIWRIRVISARGDYHGHTSLALSAGMKSIDSPLAHPHQISHRFHLTN